MVLYVVVLSLAVLGFRYYICALLMLGVKMVATLVCLIVPTTGIVCCTFIKRAVLLGNFALGERLPFCLKMFCELHRAMVLHLPFCPLLHNDLVVPDSISAVSEF